MTPKEKAKELIDSFHQLDPDTDSYNGITFQVAKKCALVCVNNILKALESDWSFMQRRIENWQEVKQEIEKL